MIFGIDSLDPYVHKLSVYYDTKDNDHLIAQYLNFYYHKSLILYISFSFSLSLFAFLLLLTFYIGCLHDVLLNISRHNRNHYNSTYVLKKSEQVFFLFLSFYLFFVKLFYSSKYYNINHDKI